jgi:hypothetical protein
VKAALKRSDQPTRKLGRLLKGKTSRWWKEKSRKER